MKNSTTISTLALTLLLSACAATPSASSVSDAAPGSVAYDRDVFQTLLGGHSELRRTVRVLPDGVETITESDDAALAALIRDHVIAMKVRLEHDGRIRQWDPIFRAVFDNASKIRMEYELTAKGVKVREQSDDPRIVRLIQAHATMVSGFVTRGTEESAIAHEVPE